MNGTTQKNQLLNNSFCFGATLCILLMCLSIYFSPEHVANNYSPDGILEQPTIFQINFFRIGFIILGAIGFSINALFIIRRDLFFLLQLKISKIKLIRELILSENSEKKSRESLMQREAINGTKNFDIYIGVSKRLITKSLIVIVFFLHLLNVFAVLLKHNFSRTFPVDFFVKVFQVRAEGMIPTWYSACTLLFCALLLSLISSLKRKSCDPYHWHWTGLATLFALMSLDEAACIHEEISAFIRGIFETTGIFSSAWVIPGIVFVLIFGSIYIKFTLDLQKQTKYLFMVAGFIYLSGVLGFEMIGSYFYKLPLLYSIISTIEEVLEMSGIVIFIYALLDYIEVYLKSKEIRLRFVE